MGAPTMTRGLPEDSFVTDTDEMKTILSDTLKYLLMRAKLDEPPISRSPRELLRCRGHVEERLIDARQVMTTMSPAMAKAFIARDVAFWIRELTKRDQPDDDKREGQAASVWVPSAFSVEYRRRGMPTTTMQEGGRLTAAPIESADPEAARTLADIQNALASQRPLTAAQPVAQKVDCFEITVAYSDVSANGWPERKYKAGVLKAKTARLQERAHQMIRTRFDVTHAYLLEHDEIQLAIRYVANVEAKRLTPKQAEDALYLKSVERNGKEKARRHSYKAIAADVERWKKEQEADGEMDAETESAARAMMELGEDDNLILAALPAITPTQLARLHAPAEPAKRPKGRKTEPEPAAT